MMEESKPEDPQTPTPNEPETTVVEDEVSTVTAAPLVNLFDKVRFYLLNSKNENVDELLKSNGANEERYLTSHITHVICDDADHSEYIEAKELFELTVVKSDWVLMSLFARTLLPVEAFSPDPNRIFSKLCAINVNLDETLSKKIHSMFTYYGGECKSEPESCTHAISTSYDCTVFDNLKAVTNDKVKFVTPDWITDCIDKGSLLNEEIYNPKYLITNPENENLLKLQEIETSEQINNSETVSLNDSHEQINKSHGAKSRTYDLGAENFFNQNINTESELTCGKTVITENGYSMLDQSQLTPNSKAKAKKSRNNRINSLNSPSVAANQAPYNNNNNNRNKASGGQASASAATSSTFNFDMDEIFHSVIGEAMSSSIRKPKPILLELVENKKDLSSDYTFFDESDQSSSIFSLYNETYYTQENSHLIKFNNCLLGCVFYLKDFEKYYSTATLDEWKKMIENYGGRVVDEYTPQNVEQITHVLCANRYSDIYKTALKDDKRIVTQFWLEDVLEEEKLKPPWKAYHFPSVFDRDNGPLKNHIIALHGFREKERLILKTLIYLLNGKFTSYLTKANSLLISTSDKGAKLDKAKEWNIPTVNGIWLMELYLGNVYTLNENIEERYKVLDIDHFAYDAIFVQELMKPWKNLIKVPIERIKDISNQENMTFKSPLKRALRSSSTKNDVVAAKQMKHANEMITWQKPQSNIPMVMFTGVNITELSQYQKDVISLGGVIAKQAHQTTHLLVNTIDRTAKLLKCINYCDFILHINWLIDSKANGKLLDPNLYTVNNEEFEKKYCCDLRESLQHVKQNGPLFAGLKFYLSPNARPSIEELEDIIKSAGGQVIRTIPTLKHITEETDKKYNHSKYILVSSFDDLCLFDALVENKIPIYNEEFVLSSVLRQKFDPDLYRLK